MVERYERKVATKLPSPAIEKAALTSGFFQWSPGEPGRSTALLFHCSNSSHPGSEVSREKWGSPRCARRASIDHQLDGVDVGGVI